MYESKSKPLASGKEFGKRMIFHVLAAFILVVVALAIGVAGLAHF